LCGAIDGPCLRGGFHLKLASLKGERDGRLVVVSDDLSWYADATHVVPSLQAALDSWAAHEPQLRRLASGLARDAIPKYRFDVQQVDAPLPRAYQWVDGSAYVNHVALVRRARNAELPESFWSDPLMYQGGSDEMLAPLDPIVLLDESWGCDFEAEIVVVTDDVPCGINRQDALTHIKLVGLVNDVSLRNLIPPELAKGFGFLQSKPASALSPVFVTPDTLGERWRDGKLNGVINIDLNGRAFGRADAGVDMVFDFGTLISHLAKTRNIGAGTLIGSGTVSNRDAQGAPGQPVERGGCGYGCIAEVRAVETIQHGRPKMSFLQPGDCVRIWMEDAAGLPIFGAIEQIVVLAPRRAVANSTGSVISQA
jgi:fumarylacetoacetate (FAA) hydrolase